MGRGGLRPGAGRSRAWGGNGGFSTNFRAAVAARARNRKNKKSPPAHFSYLFNEARTDRNGGKLSAVLATTFAGIPAGGPPDARYAFACSLLALLMLCQGKGHKSGPGIPAKWYPRRTIIGALES